MRLFNRLAALVLALILIAGGLLIALEAALAAFRRTPWLIPSQRWHDVLVTTRLSDRPALVTAGALLVVGLALLVAEVRRWPPSELPIRLDAADSVTQWRVLRRPAERRLADAAADVVGVGRARARVRLRGREHWRVYVLAEAREDSRGMIEEAVDTELARLAAPMPAEVRLRLTRPRRVA